MKKRRKAILVIAVVVGLTLVTWIQGWCMIHSERRAHRPVCYPVAPFIVFSHDTNKTGPAADGIYLAYLFGVKLLTERVIWRCG